MAGIFETLFKTQEGKKYLSQNPSDGGLSNDNNPGGYMPPTVDWFHNFRPGSTKTGPPDRSMQEMVDLFNIPKYTQDVLHAQPTYMTNAT
jgi:hypothetical protein